MEETYLCFESDAALFLLPLGLVSHILPGKARTGRMAADEDQDPEIPVIAACRLWGKGADAAGGAYMVLLQKDGRHKGLLVANVLGVYPADPRKEKEIPQEARGEQNIWLKKAVYLDQLDRWAYILDERFVSEFEGL